MFIRRKIFSLLFACALATQIVACGNVDRASLQKSASTASPVGRITFNTPAGSTTAPGMQNSELQYGACTNLLNFVGTSGAANAQLLQSATACKSTNTPGYVKINTPKTPSNTKICVFPVDASNILYPEVCVYTNGAADIALGITTAAEVYVVVASDETAFNNYADGTASAPSMSYGSL